MIKNVGTLLVPYKKKAAGTPPFVVTNSLNFVGSSTQYCARADAAAHDFSTAMTGSVWVKGANTADYARVVSKADNGAAQLAYWMQRSGSDAGKWGAITCANGFDVYKNYVSSVNVFDNTWHHLVFTFGSSTLNLYNDRVLDAAPTKVLDQVVNSIFDSNAGLTFGGGLDSGVPSALYTGKMCHASLWNIALNQSQINELASGGHPADLSTHSQYAAHCVSWYKAGDGDTIAANGIIDTKGSLSLSPTNSPTIVADAP